MKRRPPKRKRLSPPERKAISLAKDRRADWWGLTEKPGIRSKVRAGGHRIARREDARLMVDDPEAADGRFAAKQKRRWRKVPGIVLAEHLVRQADLRAVKAKYGRTARARLRREAE